MYTAVISFPGVGGVVRTGVDVWERLHMQQTAIGTGSPCWGLECIASCPRKLVLVEHFSCNNRFGEGRNLKTMSESKQGSSLHRENSKGSLRRKGSLGNRLLRKLSSKRDGEDGLADLAESVSGPSSFTLGTVDEKAKPEHLVILVNGIAGRYDRRRSGYFQICSTSWAV